MNTMSERADDREEIETLLPWHAAGTLSRRDAERVEKALASDQELARRFELVREELSETIHLNESLGAPSARAMEKLFAAIDAESATARKPRFSFDLRTKVAEFFAGFGPRTMAFASAAAVLVILLQAGVIGSMLIKTGGGAGQYDTASYKDEAAKVDSIPSRKLKIADAAAIGDMRKAVTRASQILSRHTQFHPRARRCRRPLGEIRIIIGNIRKARHA